MKRYPTKDLQPGMVVGSPIYNSNGQMMAETGTVLTDNLISRLLSYGIYQAIIQDGSPDEPEPEPTEMGSQPEVQAQAEPMATAQPEPQPQPQAQAEPVATPQPEPQPQAKPTPTAQPKAQPEPTATPQPEPQAQAEPTPTAQPETQPQATAQPKTQPEPAVAAQPQAQSQSEPQQPDAQAQNDAEGASNNYLDYSQSQSAKIKRNPDFQKFQILYTKGFSTLQTTFSDILQNINKPLDTDHLLGEVRSLMHSNHQSSLSIFDMLHNMRQIDDSIYAHSLNVALIARTLGKWLKFPAEDLRLLTLCGLLHDIGKTALPPELLNKPDNYTEEEFAMVKRHPILGMRILQNQPLNEHIKNAVLMHHERCDGSGYPSGLKMEDLDDFAMIIAIADVYDAMTAARSYRKPLCPFQVISAFEKDGLQKYHPKYILTFLEHIADTYQHNRVLLNNGQSANIVLINKKHLTQPYIQFDDETVLDMTTQPELEIVSIL